MSSNNRRSMDDLLGSSNAPKPVEPETNWAVIRKGVTQSWLVGALGMDKRTVKKRLADCPKVGRNERGYELYDLAQAMSYLVKPKFDVAEYIRTMNPTELPPMLKKEYWDAENKRMTWMERAGELWHTNDVLGVLAEAFKLMRDTMQTWPDDVERVAGLDRKQYEALAKKVDVLREELYSALVDMPKRRKTGSILTLEGPKGDEAESDVSG